MKTFILIIVLICSNSIFSQQKLDTIYANEQKNVALFFLNPIRQGITGADHFVFSYNREKEQYFGLLQATPGTESNLLTVTKDGKVYSYILKYSHRLPKLNYFIAENESIGNVRPIVETHNEKKAIDPYKNRKDYFQRASKYLLKSKYQTISTRRKKGVKLEFQKMVYDGSEVYLVLEVKNNSGINFEIGYMNIYRSNGNKKRKASFQRLQQEVIYKYKIPSIVRDKQSERFVYVLPKFVLGDNEKLQIELQELKGSRNVTLKIRL